MSDIVSRTCTVTAVNTKLSEGEKVTHVFRAASSSEKRCPKKEDFGTMISGMRASYKQRQHVIVMFNRDIGIL